MWANVPGLWIAASLVGTVGVAMQVRWALTRTQAGGARLQGMIRASLVEFAGLITLILSAQTQTLVVGLVIMIAGGILVGFIAARALRPPF